MDKPAIKKFAIWARNKLIADTKYRAGLVGVTETTVAEPLPQSTESVQFFDVGLPHPTASRVTLSPSGSALWRS